MGIRTKLNLGLLAVFAVAFASAWLFLGQQFEAGARREVMNQARIMLSAANAVRGYTIAEVVPAVQSATSDWVSPVTVPSYAAQYNFRAVRADNPDYTYKEAALNPTNPSDRAADWEADFINSFRNTPSQTELIAEREVRGSRVLTLARPITIRNEACLVCHSIPANAPARMIAAYGPNNGFGWRMNETIGAQLVSVAMDAPLAAARGYLFSAMMVVLGIFVGLMLALNLLLHFVILRPMATISRTATAVSLGQADALDFPVTGRDEIADLGRAFTRMRRSLEQALKMIDS